MTQPWRTDQWFTSPWNFENHFEETIDAPIRIHDVTLRDGEQQAGITFNPKERIAIGKGLADAGVDRIEVGVPAESEEDRAVASELASLGLTSELFAFSGHNRSSVSTALQCGLQGMLVKMVTSDHLLESGYRQTLRHEMSGAVETLGEAKAAGLATVLFAIDATRTELPRFLDIIEEAVGECHPDAVAIADSYGGANAAGITRAVRALRQRIQLPVEIHCHDDFGLAVSNTLAGLAAGATCAHVTVTGIGERAGNAALESVAMALRCLYGVETGIRTEKLWDLSGLVQRCIGYDVPPNRAIVGKTLCDIESAVVAMLYRRCRSIAPLECMPFRPEFVGHPEGRLVLGKSSGRDNVQEHLVNAGLSVTGEQEDAIVERVRVRSVELKRTLDDGEFDEIVAEVVRTT